MLRRDIPDGPRDERRFCIVSGKRPRDEAERREQRAGSVLSALYLCPRPPLT